MTQTILTFVLPWIPKSKKNAHAARGGMIYVTGAAKKDQQAIRDAARAFLAHKAGALDERQYEEFLEGANNFRAGNIMPKEWDRRCEPLESYKSIWGRSPIKITVEVFRERGQATEGSTRVTIERLDWNIDGDIRRLTDIDGAATTLLDALAGVFYGNDKQVEELSVTRYRMDHDYAHGSAPNLPPELTSQSPG